MIMRWKIPPKPPNGSFVKTKKFAFFPKTFENTRIWWEKYYSYYKVHYYMSGDFYYKFDHDELIPEEELFNKKFERKLK